MTDPDRVDTTTHELLYLADQQAYLRTRYSEDDPDLIRESMVIEWALRRTAAPAATGDVREAIRRAALEWFATGLIDESDKRAVTSFARWLTESAALSAAPVERGRGEKLTSTKFDEVDCINQTDCGWPECDCPRKDTPIGFFACPICGEETPHHHATKIEKRAECSGCMNPACRDCF